jgi:site-specific recombinase XerD
MDDDYEVYKEECKKIKADNEILLKEFENELVKAGGSAKTVKTHVTNMDFYLNEFLLYEEAIPADEGCDYISSFFFFFTRKCLWASPTSVNSNVASIKKFYKFMVSRGAVSEEDYQDLLSTIKFEKDEWLSAARFDEREDSDSEFPW